VNNVKENLAQYVFETVIPRNIRLAEAPSHGMPITEYDSRSIGAKSYINLAKELIKKNK
jgi:chromosome partitioning protein